MKQVIKHELAIAFTVGAVLLVISVIGVMASRRAPDVRSQTGIDPYKPMPAPEFARPVPKE
ncbi:hypothetical protein EPO34_01955 [Patescibacteria group bacterium]|nr:MAG: hypothetical protein EPO34_01955 [Patescibacteria group bacterium]